MAHWALCLDLNIRISATSLIRKTLPPHLHRHYFVRGGEFWFVVLKLRDLLRSKQIRYPFLLIAAHFELYLVALAVLISGTDNAPIIIVVSFHFYTLPDFDFVKGIYKGATCACLTWLLFDYFHGAKISFNFTKLRLTYF